WRLSAEYRPVAWCSNCRSITASMPLAPNRNNSALSQESPSSSFIRASHSSDCLAVRIPPAGLKPTAIPVSCAYSRIARVMTRLTGSVALTASLPVDVLMKSAPAIIATKLARATLRRYNESVLNANGRDLDIEALDAQLLHKPLLKWLPCLGAKPANALPRVVAGKRRQIHTGDGAQEPSRLPFFLYCSPGADGLHAAFDGAGVYAHRVHPIQVQRDAAVGLEIAAGVICDGGIRR